MGAIRYRLSSVLNDDARLGWLARRLGAAVALLVLVFAAYYAYDRYVVLRDSPLEQGVRALETGVRQNPNDPELRLQIANAYVRQGRYEQAITQFNEALKLKENWQPALMGIAAAELARGDQPKAEKVYREIANRYQNAEMRYANRDLQFVYYRLGLFASKAGRHAEAADWARETLKVDRTDADALYLLATSEEAQGNLAPARDAYRQAVAFDPNFREAFAGLHRVSTSLGDAREASYARGMELLAAGDRDGALVVLSPLVREAPDYAEALEGLGLAYARKGQREEAIQALRAALDRKPNLLLAQWTLGSLEAGR